MKMCEEMTKLRQTLTDKGIEWIDKSTIKIADEIQKLMEIMPDVNVDYLDTSMYRTHFDYKGTRWSVINGYGSYGGYDPIDGKNEGLLELLIDGTEGNEPIGNLTADDILNYMETYK